MSEQPNTAVTHRTVSPCWNLSKSWFVSQNPALSRGFKLLVIKKQVTMGGGEDCFSVMGWKKISNEWTLTRGPLHSSALLRPAVSLAPQGAGRGMSGGPAQPWALVPPPGSSFSTVASSSPVGLFWMKPIQPLSLSGYRSSYLSLPLGPFCIKSSGSGVCRLLSRWTCINYFISVSLRWSIYKME